MRRRDGIGAYVLVLATVLGTALIAVLVLGKARPTLPSTNEHFHRHVIAGALDPITATLLGLGPASTRKHPGSRSRAIRAVVVRERKIVLRQGGKQLRSLPAPKGALSLQAVVRAVDDRRWLSESNGTVTALAALIVDRSSVYIRGAETHALALANRPGVFLGVRRGTLRLDGVRVSTAGDHNTLRNRRPFVIAQRARLLIDRSSFVDLGYDWTSSYGVSWTRASSGAITNSRLLHCFIGIYTADAHDLLIRGNHLYGNALYGIDPHSRSTRITVDRNVSERNGRHGIIFSDRVSSSTVTRNVTRHKRLNGIVMDANSNDNAISGNVAIANRGDGIVLAGSSRNTVTDNRIEANRVGVLVRNDAHSNRVYRNEVTGNVVASQGIGLERNAVHGNGGQWKPLTVIVICLIAGVIAYFLLIATWATRRSRDQAIRRRIQLRGVPQLQQKR